MNKPASFGRFQVSSALVTAFALVGCITVGGDDSSEDGCSENSDCDDGEVCDDGECRSVGSGSGGTNAGGTNAGGTNAGGTNASGSGGSVAGTGNGGSSGGSSSCEVFCEWSDLCSDTAPSECLPGCQTSWAMGGACRTAIDRIAPCLAANSDDCTAVTGACSAQSQALLDACSTTDCPYTNDGICDEPDLCPAGTDTVDCSTCPYTNDGDCDEPEGLDLCPEGTDVNDCTNPCIEGSAGNTCVWACDEECDEPPGSQLCTAGTDTYDCTYFP
jgi:hypothetical protein